MSVRGPYTNPSSKHGRRTCKGPVRRPEWSAQALVAVIPAILSCSPSAGNPARTTGARRRFRQLLTLARVASHTCPQYHQLPKRHHIVIPQDRVAKVLYSSGRVGARCVRFRVRE